MIEQGKISFCIPSLKPNGLRQCIESLALVTQPYEVLVNSEVIGCNRSANKLIAEASGQYVCLLADDAVATSGMIDNVLAVMATLPDGWGLVGFNDGIHDGNEIATHWIADQRMINALGGKLICEEYKHCFADNEITDRAKEIGRYAWAKEATLIHNHPLRDGKKIDLSVYPGYAKETYLSDMATYNRRKRERAGFGKVAIALRKSQQDDIFFDSWTMLITGGTERGDIILKPAYRLPHGIACNFLVKQFLKSDADSILFVDDDHDFDQTTLASLRNKVGYDALMALTVSRHGEFLPIALRNTPGGREVIQNLRGQVPVDFVGLGFTLIKRGVIDNIIKLRGTDEFFNFDNALGEDGQFSQDLQLVGAKMAVDCETRIGHNVTMSVFWNVEKSVAELRHDNFGLCQNGNLNVITERENHGNTR